MQPGGAKAHARRVAQSDRQFQLNTTRNFSQLVHLRRHSIWPLVTAGRYDLGCSRKEGPEVPP